MSKFSVNEIAIIIEKGSKYDLINMECEIKSLPYNWKDGSFGYNVEVLGYPSNGTTGLWFLEEHELRKKKPPQELARWEDAQEFTGWNPTKEPVDA